MLSLLLLHIVASVFCLLLGFAGYSQIGRWITKQGHTFKPAIVYLISGLIIATGISQLIILFIPLNGSYKGILLGLLLLFIAFSWKSAIVYCRHLYTSFKKYPLIIKIAIAATWLMILMMCSGPTIMDDTESYHIQMVKWIQEYGTVTGIANLHERFGFNSSWFSSIAFFMPSQQPGNYFTALNGLIGLWFATYLLFKSANGSFSYLIVFVLSVIAWPLLRGNAATANYDFIAVVVIFVLFSETLSANSHQPFRFAMEWIAWPVYLFSVRIIHYPLLMLSICGIAIFWQQHAIKKMVAGILFCLLLAIPFLVRNVMLSGYILYPSISFNWFAVDWKADTTKTLELLRYIKYYNRVNTGIQSVAITEKIAFPQWIASWFNNLFSYDKLIFVSGFIGILLTTWYKKLFSFVISRYVQLFVIAILIQFVSFFFIAPDPRFIYGCLLSGILLILLAIEKRYFSNVQPVWNKVVVVIGITGIVAYSLHKIIVNSDYRNFIIPATLPQPPVRNIPVDGIIFHIPEKILNNWNPRCYGTSLPCLYEIDPRLQLRGTTIADGFRLRK